MIMYWLGRCPIKLLALTFALLVGTAAALGWHALAAGTSAVTIDNFAFGPATLTVARGTTVTWTNKDDEPHTVATEDKRIKSPALDTDDNFQFTFNDPGTYKYFCSIHPRMQGTVIVQ
jgi:plastocyanin